MQPSGHARASASSMDLPSCGLHTTSHKRYLLPNRYAASSPLDDLAARIKMPTFSFLWRLQGHPDRRVGTALSSARPAMRRHVGLAPSRAYSIDKNALQPTGFGRSRKRRRRSKSIPTIPKRACTLASLFLIHVLNSFQQHSWRCIPICIQKACCTRHNSRPWHGIPAGKHIPSWLPGLVSPM
jgi:hypothetical protein